MSFVVDCGYLAEVQKKVEDVWTNPLQNIDKIPLVGTAKALLDNQQVAFSEFQDKNKNKVVNLEWQTACDLETEDCGDDCTITGEDVTPACEDYEMECLQEISFKMPMRNYRDLTANFQDNLAINIAYRKKMLLDWLNEYVTAGLIANAGVNQLDGMIGDVVDGVTYIPANYWDEQIWGYLAQVSEFNQFSSPYLISGNNLYQQVWNAKMKGGAGMFDWLRPTFDIKTFANLSISDQTLLVHKTAAAFVNKAWNPLGMENGIEQVGGQYLEYSDSLGLTLDAPINIPGLGETNVIGLPNVFVDITMQQTCSNNEFYLGVKLKLWGKFVVNPKPCDDDQTGILLFECGVAEN